MQSLVNKYLYTTILAVTLILSSTVFSQADNEIQVYASSITPRKVTLLELHQNHTFKGASDLSVAKDAKWTFETLEITRGLGNNFEIGFYTFTGISPNGKVEYLGNHIRPRFTFPDSWHLGFGASVSLELGFIRPNSNNEYVMDGELRPIIDKKFGKMYFSLNPNIAFILTGNNKSFDIGPQFKTVYTIKNKFGLGLEYYTDLGTFKKINAVRNQEHLLGPMFDLYSSPNWELQTGFLFGLTPGSNHQVFKLIFGRRLARNSQKGS